MPAKAKSAFRTISEVAAWLDVPTHVLRFWESKFPQIKPVKRAGGRRYYRPEDMRLIGGIKHMLHDQGVTIRGVQKKIKEDGVDAVSILSPNVDKPAETPPSAEQAAPSVTREIDPYAVDPKEGGHEEAAPEAVEQSTPPISPPKAIDPVMEVSDIEGPTLDDMDSFASGLDDFPALEDTSNDPMEPQSDTPLSRRSLRRDALETEAAVLDQKPADPALTSTEAFATPHVSTTEEETDMESPTAASETREPEQPDMFDTLAAHSNVLLEQSDVIDTSDAVEETSTVASEEDEHEVVSEVEATLEPPAEIAQEDSISEVENSIEDAEIVAKSEESEASFPVDEIPMPDLDAIEISASQLASLGTITALRKMDPAKVSGAVDLTDLFTRAQALRQDMAAALRRASGA